MTLIPCWSCTGTQPLPLALLCLAVIPQRRRTDRQAAPPCGQGVVGPFRSDRYCAQQLLHLPSISHARTTQALCSSSQRNGFCPQPDYAGLATNHLLALLCCLQTTLNMEHSLSRQQLVRSGGVSIHRSPSPHRETQPTPTPLMTQRQLHWMLCSQARLGQVLKGLPPFGHPVFPARGPRAQDCPVLHAREALAFCRPYCKQTLNKQAPPKATDELASGGAHWLSSLPRSPKGLPEKGLNPL